MTIFEQIVRIFLGGRPKSRLLVELFKSESDADGAIILEEIGFPHGGVSTYTWWRSSSSGFFRKSHRSFNETEVSLNKPVVTQNVKRVDELFSLIEEFGDLTDYSKSVRVRDGGLYRVSWGTKDKQQTLTIRIPAADSRHYQLVMQLKGNAWK